jgi:tRNA (cmo5U34)-methyltransferase
MKDPRAFDFDGDYGEIYDDIARTVIPGYEQLFQATLALLGGRLGSRANVLVVGCGTGKEIAALAPAEPGWSITGVDPSAEMVGVTRSVVRRLGVESRVAVVHGEVDALPAQASFDAATVINVMHFLRDDGTKAALMEAVATRVRPGGPILLFDLHGDPVSEAFQELDEAWVSYMRIRGLQGEALEEFLERLRKGIDYVPESRIMEICRSVGLEPQFRYFGGFHYGGWLLTRGRPA